MLLEVRVHIVPHLKPHNSGYETSIVDKGMAALLIDYDNLKIDFSFLFFLYRGQGCEN